MALCLTLFSNCNNSKRQFKILNEHKTGISFQNSIPESDSLNIIINNYMYNGAGVGIADFNNDGLQDVFFAGNLVNNKLYLNKGNLKFIDVSEISKIEGKGQWFSGVNIFDINNDDLLDIYITATFNSDPELRKNILFINKGNDENNVPIFENQAEQYNLDDTNFTTHSLAFDYDKDGDLDLYLLNNMLEVSKTGALFNKFRTGDSPSNDRLYRNDNGIFTDVTLEANIKDFGFGLGIALIDANDDSWPDLYISNDFVTNDLLYINQKDGTFENKIGDYLNHQSFSSMGNDIADINNDGLEEIFTLDMLPRKDARMKMMFGGLNHYYYDIMLTKKYELEYARNVFQFNRGNGKFSDISMISDLHNTDWSWSILMQDYTNDGLKDMFISNGFPRDITDLDFSDYHSGINVLRSVDEQLLSIIPQVKIPNIFVENEGNLQFKDVSKTWIKEVASYSNGAAYGDLDNDGDLDLIVSNINDPAFVYENTENSKFNYIQIDLKKSNSIVNPIGSKIYCFTKEKSQLQVFQPNRGYCSTSQNIAHFGLGKELVDSIQVVWPDGNIQTIVSPEVNKKHTIIYKTEKQKVPKISDFSMFTKIDSSSLLQFKHEEKKFYDFDVQALVQSLNSENGPPIAVADLDNNGTDDIVFGGNLFYPTNIAYQDETGRFSLKELVKKTDTDVASILVFDLNQDGLQDIFFTQGSSEVNSQSKYKNRIYINKGNQIFQEDTTLLQSKEDFGHSCITACDFDKDGDIDLFLGAHSIPSKFPLSGKPQLLINNNGVLVDQFEQFFNFNEQNYLINSAIWSDVNNDSWPDLITVGKWNPILIHLSESGKSFKTQKIPKSNGLWTSIIGSDLDNDGDIDYILGNQGLNNKYRFDAAHPIKLYAKDFDKNGSIDLIMSHYIENDYRPYNVRNDVTKQLKSLSKVFKNYKSFAEANTDFILSNLDTTGMSYYAAETLESSILWNKGDMQFSLQALPYETQFSCVHGIMIKNMDDDMFPDLISVGNDYGTEVFSGRTDAGYGNIMLNNGTQFNALPSYKSNFYAGGNTRGIVGFQNAKTSAEEILVGRNNDTPLVFQFNQKQDFVELPFDVFRIRTVDKNNDSYIQEYYNGASYFSQQSKIFYFNSDKINAVYVTNTKGEEKQIYPKEAL